MKTMFIMSGCQGSGKSTWIKKAYPKVVVSADHYFIDDKGEYCFSIEDLGKAHAECFRKAILSVQAGMDCVIDNTNSTIIEIAPYYQLAKAYGYEVVIVKVSCDVEKAVKRNVHNVPESVVKATAKRCESLNFPSFWSFATIEVHT